MAIEVKMPRLSLTMESGVLLQWLKAEGDHVAKGEELAEIETDKAGVVMESPATGYLRRVLVAQGQDVPCDTVLAILTESADEAPAGAPVHAEPAAAAPVPSAQAPVEVEAQPHEAVPAASSASGGRPHVNASPAAKNLARELGVDLAMVVGTGPRGRIGLEDVQRAADTASSGGASNSGSAAPEAAGARTGTVSGAAIAGPVGDRRVPLTRMRAAIAQRMTLSATTVPQFTVRRRVDMTAALRLRDTHSSMATGEARRPSVIDVLHLAVVRALQAHPEVNASYESGMGDERGFMVQHEAVNLGIAVALSDGLLVPVIHNAHVLTLDELVAARVRLQQEAHGGRLSARALSGGTFTVSNLGTMHVDEFAAIVNPPEAAILAVGRVQQELVVRDNAIHMLPMMALTVTADHRVLDGAGVARFLDTLAGYLEAPGAPT